MTGAPTWVEEAQLAELGIELSTAARTRRDEEAERE
jgi:hypothetical protein